MVPSRPQRATGGRPLDGPFAAAIGAWAAGVTLLTVADGRDDIGTTVSAFCPVSTEPPLILVSLMASSYPAEVLAGWTPSPSRCSRPGSAARGPVRRGRAAGGPAAARRGRAPPRPASGALIADDGLAALECQVRQRVPAGDHLLLVAGVLAVPYVAPAGAPLIRFRGGYPPWADA